MEKMYLLITLFLGVFWVNSNAQNIHTAPQVITIDGNANEWNDNSLTHNSQTDVNFAIANDDQNLYLIVEASNHTIVNKILGGGVTFAINADNKKNLKNSISVTYPVLDLHHRVWVDLRDPSVSQSSQNDADSSSMEGVNTELTNRSKFIMVTGFKDVDTIISIYNHDGIKAAARFDNKMAYTYELAINLKLLGLNANDGATFAYNIKLPGVDMAAVFKASGYKTIVSNGKLFPSGRLPGITEEYLKNNPPSFPVKVSLNVFTNPTDFWGEYTIVQNRSVK